jgi:hypothetical protein
MFALWFVVACSPPLPDGPPPLAPHDDPASAPYPFTPDQIREANPAGSSWVFDVTAPDKPVLRRTMTFRDPTPEGAFIRSTIGPPAGPPDEATEAWSNWAELQRHAAYPSAARIGWARVRVPHGRHDCVEYRVETEERTTVACFDPSLPGPPVRLEESTAGYPVFVMELVDRQGAGTAASSGS